MLLDVLASGPPDAVKLLIEVLATNSGYAPSSSSIEPAAAYPVPAYVTVLELSDSPYLTLKL